MEHAGPTRRPAPDHTLTAPAVTSGPPVAPVPLSPMSVVNPTADDIGATAPGERAETRTGALRRLRPAPADAGPHQHGPGCDHLRRTATPGWAAAVSVVAGTAGSQASSTPGLDVTSADDTTEVAADRAARAAVARLHGGVATPRLHRSAAGGDGCAEVGPAGGAVSEGLQERVDAARAGGGRPLDGPVRRRMESAMDADLSAVRVHSGPEAAALSSAVSARAFTVGSDVFLPDGVPDTDTAPGAHLLAHELAHAVDPAAGAGATSARRATARRVVQVDGRLGSAAHAESEAPVSASSLRVERVVLPHQYRPPTSLDKGAQGRHIIAWAARLLEWEACFRGDLDDVLETLATRIAGDKAASPATAEEYDSLARRVAAVAGSDHIQAPLEWSSAVSAFVTDYVLLYQRSEFAAFASINPKGKGESSTLADLKAAEDGSQPQGADALQVLFHRLVDRHPGLSDLVRTKVDGDWRAMCRTLFPLSWASAFPDDESPDEDATDMVLDVDDLDLVDEDVDEDDEAVPAEPEGLPGRGFFATLDLGPVEPDDEAGRPASDFVVEALDVGWERAQGRHVDRRQGNHVIPWSLERMGTSKRFVGQPLDRVLKELKEEIAGARAVPDDLDALATEADAVAVDGSQTGLQWKRDLDVLVRAAIELEQASPQATYPAVGDEKGTGRPEGHGEGAALTGLRRVEEQLEEEAAASAATTGPPAPTSAAVFRDSLVKYHLRPLVDLPGLDSTRKARELFTAEDLEEVRDRWLAKLTHAFPLVMEHFAKEAKEVFAEKVTPADFYRVRNAVAYVEERRSELLDASGQRGKKSARLAARGASAGSGSDERTRELASLARSLTALLRFSEGEKGREAALKEARLVLARRDGAAREEDLDDEEAAEAEEPRRKKPGSGAVGASTTTSDAGRSSGSSKRKGGDDRDAKRRR